MLHEFKFTGKLTTFGIFRSAGFGFGRKKVEKIKLHEDKKTYQNPDGAETKETKADARSNHGRRTIQMCLLPPHS